jgi:hypothetical protein
VLLLGALAMIAAVAWMAEHLIVFAGAALLMWACSTWDATNGRGHDRVRPSCGTIDRLIYSASMILLDAVHHAVNPPPLARWLLAARIDATLFANVLAGAAYRLLGAAVAAWPALALVGSYELLMWLVRHGVTAPAGAAGTVSPPVPSDAETAATASLRAILAAGNPWSNDQLADRFGLTRAQGRKCASW